MITQEQYNTATQQFRNLHLKINILNFRYQIVNEISGDAISGNIAIDANADLRRSCSVSVVVTDSRYNIESGSAIWLDKYIQIYVGVDNIQTGEIIWMNQGIYLIDAPSWIYDAQTKTLTFNGLDLMSKMTGLRNGNLAGIPTEIPAGTNIRDAVISTLQLAGFYQYEIPTIDRTLPYTIKVDVGGTVFDILSQLRDIYPMWQMYFDVYGVFCFNQIPIDTSTPILVDNDVFDECVISENVSTDFTSVKNVCEVIGKSIAPAYFANATIVQTPLGDTLNLQIPQVSTYTADVIYGFLTPPGTSQILHPLLQINSFTPYGIYDYTTIDSLPWRTLDDNTYYVCTWTPDRGPRGSAAFLMMGHQNPTFTATDTNSNSPFNINTSVGQIRKVFYGGEYDNIYTDAQAKERAEWELYNHTRMKDSVDLACVPIYWLDVNIVGRYTTKFNNQTALYLIKSINTDLSVNGTQTINMIKFYNYYNT